MVQLSSRWIYAIYHWGSRVGMSSDDPKLRSVCRVVFVLLEVQAPSEFPVGPVERNIAFLSIFER